MLRNYGSQKHCWSLSSLYSVRPWKLESTRMVCSVPRPDAASTCLNEQQETGLCNHSTKHGAVCHPKGMLEFEGRYRFLRHAHLGNSCLLLLLLLLLQGGLLCRIWIVALSQLMQQRRVVPQQILREGLLLRPGMARKRSAGTAETSNTRATVVTRL